MKTSYVGELSKLQAYFIRRANTQGKTITRLSKAKRNYVLKIYKYKALASGNFDLYDTFKRI